MNLLKLIKILTDTLLKSVDSNRLKPTTHIEYPLNKGLPEYFSTNANCTVYVRVYSNACRANKQATLRTASEIILLMLHWFKCEMVNF